MARSFAQFGKLPEGPRAPVDLGELVRYAARSTTAPGVDIEVQVAADTPTNIGMPCFASIDTPPLTATTPFRAPMWRELRTPRPGVIELRRLFTVPSVNALIAPPSRNLVQ